MVSQKAEKTCYTISYQDDALKLVYFWSETLIRGGEISKLYTCPRTTGCKISTCTYQGTTCPYTNKYKICQPNVLMNAL